ncbi:major facilitator superfamily domain-containing protein [Cadophora sp. MPI-SDFR-AT-0126]|nr:major facilitator superfamily domain-containing protein [Leotiomycetes sp. MPI-SDFR-AT-0126]
MIDETEPLLGHVRPESILNGDQKLVDFNPDGDSENPLDWSRAYKLEVVALLSFMAFTVSFTCIGVVPVADRIVFDLGGGDSKAASILLVTVWELGEAAGPFLMAPLSEIYGRYPVFNFANIIFIFGVVLGALSHTTSLFIFSRLLTGFAVASNVLNPAIIGDIFKSESRGSGMSLVMFAPLIGGTIGPAISGVLAETVGWRNILWLCAGVATLCEILFCVLLRETYKVTILQRRAARMRIETKDESLKCAWETEGGDTDQSWAKLRTAITRPLLVMCSSAVLQIMSFYAGFAFTFYYIVATTLPGILREHYGFSPAQTGSVFICFSVGAISAIIVCNLSIDRIYVKLAKSHGGIGRPEFRLPFMIGGAAFLPFVVGLYGWVPYSDWSIYLLLVVVAALGFVSIVIGIPMSSYIVDSFGIYSASAMTVVLLTRCSMGTLLPLCIPLLTDALGLGYGFLVLAAICVVVIPLPALMMRYGSHWRQKSVYTRTE